MNAHDIENVSTALLKRTRTEGIEEALTIWSSWQAVVAERVPPPPPPDAPPGAPPKTTPKPDPLTAAVELQEKADAADPPGER